MKTEKLKLKDIKPNPDNPRVIRDWQFEKLKKSIQEFPQMLEIRPIVVDENNIILGGNQRFRALQELGYKEIPIIRANELTEEQKREFIIKDNLPYGEWDWTILDDWDVDELTDWGLQNIYAVGHEVNNMTDDDVDLEQEFDPIGVSKGLTRIVIIHDNLELAKKWIDTNIPNLEYKKKGNDENIILQVNLSSNYGK